jgi:hypothetical protein
MNNPSNHLIAELAELGAELKRDEIDNMPANHKKLHVVAHKLLQLERDLAVPGADISAASRQSRIMDMIQDEDF